MRVNVYIQREQYQLIENMADQIGISKSYLIKELISAGLRSFDTDSRKLKRLGQELKRQVEADRYRLLTKIELKKVTLAINQRERLKKLMLDGVELKDVVRIKNMMWKEAKALGWKKPNWERVVGQSGLVGSKELNNIDNIIVKRK